MNRTKGVLAAGTFTGLVLITILALGFGGLQAQSSGNVSTAPATEIGLPLSNGLTSEETLQAWQDYSAQLEQTVRTLQQRDLAYQQQLEVSNQTILQLQEQINSGLVRPSFGEHEREEHEAFEFEVFDD